MGWPPFDRWVTELAQMFQQIAVGLAAIGTGVTALFALRTWRAELKGKAQYDVARRLYICARRFAYEFNKAQKATLEPAEWSARDKSPGESEAMAAHRNEAFARQMRASRLLEQLKDLQQLGWETDLVLDIDTEGLIGSFDKAWNSYFASLNIFYDDGELRIQSGGQGIADIEDVREHGKVVLGRRDNPVEKQLESALSALKAALRQYVH